MQTTASAIPKTAQHTPQKRKNAIASEELKTNSKKRRVSTDKTPVDDSTPKKQKKEKDSKKKNGKGKEIEVVHEDTSEDQQNAGADGDDDVEDIQSPLQEKGVAESDSDTDADAEPPQHETLQKTNKKKSATKKVKYVPEGETREQRDMRSIFVGNLPVAIVKSKVCVTITISGGYCDLIRVYLFS